jgi:hypothetical protein
MYSGFPPLFFSFGNHFRLHLLDDLFVSICVHSWLPFFPLSLTSSPFGHRLFNR